MSEQQAITRVVDVELIPSSELPGLREILAELNTVVRTELPELAERARAYSIKTKQDYIDAAPDLKRLREIGELGEDRLRPSLDILNTMREYLLDAIKKQRLAAKPAVDELSGKLAEYNRLEKLAAQQEQDRINAENRRKAAEAAEEQRKKDEAAAAEKREARVKELKAMLKAGKIGKRTYAQELKAAGTAEEADKAFAEVQAAERAAAVPEVRVVPNKVPVAGLRARTQWVFKIVDIEKIPRALLYPNRGPDGEWKPEDFPRLGDMVRKTKNKAVAEKEAGGGIEVLETDKV